MFDKNPTFFSEIIGTIGDINPVDHSGGIIGCVDGEYRLDYLEVLEEENAWLGYTINLDKVEDVDTEFGSCHVNSVCSCCDIEKQELQRLFASDDPQERAMAYWIYSMCWGWERFDSSPLRFEAEDEAMLRERFSK